MSHHDEQPNLNPENPNPGWKDRDINMKVVVWSTTATFAVAICTMVAMFFLVNSLKDRELNFKGPSPERVLPEGDVILQVNAVEDLEVYLANETKVLTSYGESGEGHVRIPIEAAKERMLAKGFAARKGEVPAHFIKPNLAVDHYATGETKASMEAADKASHHDDHGHDHGDDHH